MNIETQTINYKRSAAGSTVSSLKAKQSELILFTTQLSVMLDSGVVLSDALSSISDQIHPGTFKSIISNIACSIESGDSFSEALIKYPKVFNTMFISMVKASEASGEMPGMLEVLSNYLTTDSQTRKQVKGAMLYPAIMFLMSVVATGSLMFFVLPRFTAIYESKGSALPGLTQLLVNFSNFFGDIKVMTTVVTMAVIVSVAVYFWHRTLSGQKVFDWTKVHTPIFGTMFIDSILTRSMRIMATMVNTGVSILDTLNVIELSCENYYFRTLWSATDAKIRDGYQLSESILLAPYSRLIAPGIIQMLRAGEKSGKLAQVCNKISIFYEKKLQNSIKTATSLIEPVMITIMGAIIGTIAIALLLPVFKISSVIAH